MLLSDRMLAFLAQFFLKKISRKFCGIEKRHYLCNRNQQDVDSVAQLVEQMTLNHWVESSSLSGVTKQSLKSGCFFYFCRPQAVAYLQHASARTGLWKNVVAPRRWTYRCGTVLSMSIKWRVQPPKSGCINQGKYFCKKFCIGDFGKVESAESQSSWRSRRTLRAASFYNRSSAVFPPRNIFLQPLFGGSCACHQCHGVGKPTPC